MNIDTMFAGENTTINSAAEKLAEFIAFEDDAIARLEDQLKARKARLEETKTQLAEIMLQNGQESIKFTNGLTPKAKIQVKYYKAAGIEDTQLFDWLNQNNMGEIIKPYVHFHTLQSAIQQFVEHGGSIPSDLLIETKTPTVVMYGKNKFLRENKQ